jgi:preprotein translocase subunit YajC
MAFLVYLCPSINITMYNILLQAGAPSQGTNWQLMITMGLMIVVFYFFLIRPQQKKAKDQKKFVEALKVGDKVVTIGGAHGRIAEVDDDTFVLEVERGGRIRFSKSAVSLDNSKPASAQPAKK